MAEYIERDVALKALCQVSAPTPSESYIVEKCIGKINDVPSVEVAPVVHGRWLYAGLFDDFAKCSVCGVMEFSIFEAHRHHYCFNCGAKMDGKEQSSAGAAEQNEEAKE